MHRYVKILKTFLSIWKQFLTEPGSIDALSAIAIPLLTIIEILFFIALAGVRIVIMAYGVYFIGIIVFLTILFMLEAVEMVKIEERALKRHLEFMKREKKTT